jgi:hypothetical protein
VNQANEYNRYSGLSSSGDYFDGIIDQSFAFSHPGNLTEWLLLKLKDIVLHIDEQ